jgi:hypothetical protein
MEYNIYCDESCHLEKDPHKSMVLGAIWCAKQDRKELFTRIKEIKLDHNLNAKFEIKWNKVSLAKLDFYRDIINFFFDTDKLNFRALVILDDRKDYILPWTAYLVKGNTKLNKLLKEYNEYKKQKPPFD